MRHFSPKFTGIMLPILSVYVSPLNLLLILTFPSPRRVISKFILVLKQWLVCMIFSAINPLHLRIHSSKNYSLIFLHVSTLISSITLPMNNPQMMNQLIQSTLQFLRFIPTIRFLFLNNFYIFLIFYATPRFLPPPPGTKHRKGPPAENDRQLEGGPEDPTPQRNRQRRRAAPTAPTFP